MEKETTFSKNDIFKYGTLKHLKDTLIHNKLGFSKAGNLNDPFEIAHHFYDSQSYGQLNRRDILDEVKISCFSRNPQEPLMWSHYADKHRGVCYIFDEMELTLYGLCSDFGDIIYSTHIPHIHFRYPENSERLETELKFQLKPVIFTKSLVWEYEKEYRIILKKGVDPIFRRKSLKGIILGYRTNLYYKRQVLKAVSLANQNRDEDIKVYYANLSTEKYEMFITEEPTGTVAENITYV
ncbi:DUF2971 domain-containing protein [Salinimicrobium sp. HB62]|uniref:DUF2971 domain-containing protein n=1 Tax=Salinimicrobium sp. HB62 TaxID=3077781 RepID=UPI002D777546|nr:DUF2971 domain-containing protein [Salinimicrobium sp. HB62]